MNISFCPSQRCRCHRSRPLLQQRVGSGGLVSAPAGAWGGKGGEHAPVHQAGHLDVWSRSRAGWTGWRAAEPVCRWSSTRDRAPVDDHTYILLIRRYREMSGTTLPAMMAPSPTAAATSNRIFICQVSLLSPSLG